MPLKYNGLDTRRNVLKTVGGMAAAGFLAGCLGDGGEGTIRVGHIGEGSMGGNAALGLQSVMRNHAEDITVSPEGTGGDVASIRLTTEGELDGKVGGMNSILSAFEGMTPFDEDPVDTDALPYQVFAPGIIDYHWVQVEGTGLTDTDDLIDRDDVNIWPLPPEFGARGDHIEIMERIEFDGSTMWELVEDRVVDVSSDDIGGAVQEGRIDAFIVITASRRGLPGYTTQIDVNTDLEYLPASDAWFDGVEQYGLVLRDSWETYGWQQDIGTDTIDGWNAPLLCSLTPDISSDVVYDLLSTVHEHNEEYQATADTNIDTGELENITTLAPEIPVHPGAVEFYREHDVWDDDLIEG